MQKKNVERNLKTVAVVFLASLAFQGCVMETDESVSTGNGDDVTTLLELMGVDADIEAPTGTCICNGASVDPDCEYSWIAAVDTCTIDNDDWDMADYLRADLHRLVNYSESSRIRFSCGFSFDYPYHDGYGPRDIDEIVMWGLDQNDNGIGSAYGVYVYYWTYLLGSTSPSSALGNCYTTGSSSSIKNCSVDDLYGTTGNIVSAWGHIPAVDIDESYLQGFMICFDVDGES